MINIEKTKRFKSRQYRNISTLLHSRPIRIVLATVIMLGLFSVIAQSFESMTRYSILFHIISFFSALIFTIEYILRIISAPHEHPHTSSFKARLRYIFSFMGFIDLISVLPFTMPYIFSATITGYSFEIARLFLIFKLFRYSDSFKTISTVLSSVKYELLTSLSFGGIIVGFCAVTMYYAEKDAQPHAFDNIGQGFWWDACLLDFIRLLAIGVAEIANHTHWKGSPHTFGHAVYFSTFEQIRR